MKRKTPIIFYFLFLFLIIEAALRLQQAYGPLLDLEFLKYDERNISYDLNHKPGPEEDYNADGVQHNRLRPARFPEGVKPLKILFLGDSFMQGYPPAQTIPQYVWEALRATDLKNEPFLFWNAGYSSYAPLLYTVQAQKLIPKYKPDFILIDIDESDMVDDFALYHPFLVRDRQGKVIGVKPSPAFETRLKGFAALRRQPLYTLRLLGMWMHKVRLYFIYKIYNQKQKGKYYRDPMSDKNGKFSFNLAPGFDRSPDAKERYRPERESFLQDLRELATVLNDNMGDSRKIIFLYHPHLYQLAPDPRGFLWRSYVPELLEQVSKETGIEFWNASSDLKREFGDRPDKFYREWDMHFYPNGLQAYSRWIAQRLLKKINQWNKETL